MGNTVSGHFGHCENFNIYDAEDGKITAEEVVANPGHRPGFLPNFLADRGVPGDNRRRHGRRRRGYLQ